MKTKLPEKITSVEEAKDFLTELFLNGESYHPEADAFTIEWHGCKEPTVMDKMHLNSLMFDIIYDLHEVVNDYVDFDPCDWLSRLQDTFEYIINKSIELGHIKVINNE